MATSLNHVLQKVYQEIAPGFPSASIKVPEAYVDPLVAFLNASCRTIEWHYDHFNQSLELHWTAGTLCLPGLPRY
jgi:hypothetical protein